MHPSERVAIVGMRTDTVKGGAGVLGGTENLTLCGPRGVRPPPNAITTIEAVAHRCRLTHTLAPMAIIGPLHLGHHLAEIGRPVLSLY
jgi:hypothetical protein